MALTASQQAAGKLYLTFSLMHLLEHLPFLLPPQPVLSVCAPGATRPGRLLDEPMTWSETLLRVESVILETSGIMSDTSTMPHVSPGPRMLQGVGHHLLTPVSHLGYKSLGQRIPATNYEHMDWQAAVHY